MHLPRPPKPTLKFAYVFDGDRRGKSKKSNSQQWPALFLPTEEDPDSLFQSLKLKTPELAKRLHIPEPDLRRFLDSQEGTDPHDWVNDLGRQYERSRVLRTLAELWVDEHETEVSQFVRDVSESVANE